MERMKVAGAGKPVAARTTPLARRTPGGRRCARAAERSRGVGQHLPVDRPLPPGPHACCGSPREAGSGGRGGPPRPAWWRRRL